MNRFMWASINPQQASIPPYVPQYEVPPVDSVDWEFVEGIDLVRLNSSHDGQTLKRLRQMFLDTTYFNSPDPRLTSKLFRALQILVERQKECISSLRERQKRINQENIRLKHKIKHNENVQRCPICLKTVKSLSALDSHMFKSHTSISYVWQQLRAPHKNTEDAFEALTRTLSLQNSPQEGNEELGMTLEKINKEISGFRRKFDKVEDKIEDLKQTINNETKEKRRKERRSSRKNKSKRSSHRDDPLDNVVTIRKQEEPRVVKRVDSKPVMKQEPEPAVVAKPAPKPSPKPVNEAPPKPAPKPSPNPAQHVIKRDDDDDSDFDMSEPDIDNETWTQQTKSPEKPKEKSPVKATKPVEKEKSPVKAAKPVEKEKSPVKAAKPVEKEKAPKPIEKSPVKAKTVTPEKKASPQPKNLPPDDDEMGFSDDSDEKGNDLTFDDFHDTPAQVLRHSSSLFEMGIPPQESPQAPHGSFNDDFEDNDDFVIDEDQWSDEEENINEDDEKYQDDFQQDFEFDDGGFTSDSRGVINSTTAKQPMYNQRVDDNYGDYIYGEEEDDNYAYEQQFYKNSQDNFAFEDSPSPGRGNRNYSMETISDGYVNDENDFGDTNVSTYNMEAEYIPKPIMDQRRGAKVESVTSSDAPVSPYSMNSPKVNTMSWKPNSNRILDNISTSPEDNEMEFSDSFDNQFDLPDLPDSPQNKRRSRAPLLN